MKNTFSQRVGTITVVLILASVMCTHTSPPPSIYPLGSAITEWFVTNSPCSVMISIQTTNTYGGLNTCGSHKGTISFETYAQFMSYVQSESGRCFNLLNLTVESSTFRYRLKTTYGADQTGLSIDTSLTTGSITQANAFPFYPQIPQLKISVPGAVSASITMGTSPPLALPISGNGDLILDGTYSTNTGRARMMVTFDDGSTSLYTQDGIRVLPPQVSLHYIAPTPPMPGSQNFPPYYYHYYNYTQQEWEEWMAHMNEWYSIYGQFYWYTHSRVIPGWYHTLVTSTKGTDTVLEGSTDLSTWNILDTLTWDSGGTTMVTPVSTNQPYGFFRARSY